MKLKLILSFCFLFSLFLKAQHITVLEKETNTPIIGVAISDVNNLKFATTDLNGKASIDKFNSDDILFFRSDSYNSLKILKALIVKSNNIVYLVAKPKGLDEVVISVSKFEQSKHDIPQKIVNINAKGIEFNNPQTSADLLKASGNVYIQKSQLGGGSPIIRGFSTNRLLITVDGVRMNNAIFRGGNIQNIISIDPFSIQNTEITLGAGSVVYGSDAIGGVMSFYTKKPQLSYKDSIYFNANSVLRYATANKEKTGHLDINLGLKKWASLTSFSYNDFDDLRMGSRGPTDYLRPEYIETINGEDVIVQNNNPLVQKPTSYNQFHALQKFRYEPKDNLSFDLGLYYSTTSNYPRYDRLINYNGNTLRSAEWFYGPQQWFMSNFNVTKLSSRSNLYDKIQATFAYQNFKESRNSRDFQSEIITIRKESVDAFSINLDLEKQLSQKTELFYGFEYVFNEVYSLGKERHVFSGIENATVSRYPNESTWQSIAAYTSVKYKPNKKFIFQTGIRYNHNLIDADFTENNAFLNLPFNSTKVNSSALTGTAGISWIPNEILQWKLNASTAYRAPNIDDIGKVFDSEPGSVVVPNNDLKPEYAYGGELGLMLNFNTIVSFDLSTYYTFLDNALVRRDYNLNGETEIVFDGQLSTVQAIQNASKAWIYGFEVGMKINFSNQFKLLSQYNIIGGSEENNGIEVPVRHVTPNFGNTHLVWNNKTLKVDAFINYNSELSFNQLAPSEQDKAYLYAKDKNGNPFSPSWYTLNCRAQYTISKAFSMVASIENITDQRYKTYSSGITSPGRNLILSLKYSL